MITPELWRKSGEWLTIRGHRLFVRSVGHGPPLLTLHAFPTSSYDYSRLIPLLVDHYQVILFDYPGFGFSDKPRPSAVCDPAITVVAYRECKPLRFMKEVNRPSVRSLYSLFEYAKCLADVANYFGIDRAGLLAHDIGDSVALIALEQQQLIIDRLLLMNGSVVSIPFDDAIMRLTQRLLLHRYLGPLIGQLGLINRRFFASTATKLFSTTLPPAERDAFWSIICYNNGARLYPILMRYMLERWRYQNHWLAVLERHTVPLTLIWGQLDPIATPAVAEAIIARRPTAHYIRLNYTGHYPHWEQPEEVAQTIRNDFR